MELQWNPDITKSEGNQKIVCFIGSYSKQEKTFLGLSKNGLV